MEVRKAARGWGKAAAACAAWVLAQSCAAGQPPEVQMAGKSLSDADWAVMERASFGPTPAMVAQFAAKGRDAWLDAQLSYVGDACLPLAASRRISALKYESYDPASTARELRKQAQEAKKSGEAAQKEVGRKMRREPIEESFERRSIRAIYCDANQLQEKMAAFWMNHFNVFAAKGEVAVFLPDYEEKAVRPRVFGSFYDLAMSTLEHPAMMEYLDNAQNAKGKVNENYARELMELHTLGVDGGYTQKDVQELARILTGAGQDLSPGGRPGERRAANGFAFSMARHDQGEKVLMGVKYPAGGGFEEIERAVRQLVDHPSTARFVSEKMARYFIQDEPSKELVARLAAVFSRTHGDLAQVSSALVHSPEFASSRLVKFKEPQDWIYSAVRLQYGQDLIVNYRPLDKWMSDLGQPPYRRQTPDGWGARASDWASADQMTKRFDMSKQIAGGAGALFSAQPKEGEQPDQEKRRAAGQGHPGYPAGLWSLSWRYSGEGLGDALGQAQGEKEKRSLVLAAPDFMKK